MKEKILSILRNTDEYVSGQELCEHLQVSRTAVWKVMNQLKEEGYVIEAVKNKGYHMSSAPDVLSEAEVASRLKTHHMGQDYYYYDVIDSTNSQAKRLAEEGKPHGTLVAAGMQTDGRGRRGRTWESPEAASIFMSLLLKPRMNPANASMMTLVMGMAVAKALEETGVQVKIKWPNDLVVDGRKVCGILTEMSTEIDYINYLVIGVGINVNNDSFPADLKETAVSLKMVTGKAVSRAELIERCMRNFEGCYETFMKTEDLSGLLEEYNELLINTNRAIKVSEPGNEYTGTARGINERGELLVDKDNGERVCVYAGEVSVRGLYGYV